MGVKYEIKAKTGEKDGKAFYSKIGVVLQGDKGFSMRLNMIPLGWDGFAILSEPEQRQSGQQRQQNYGGGQPTTRQQGYGNQGRGGQGERYDPPADPDDDIPF